MGQYYHAVTKKGNKFTVYSLQTTKFDGHDYQHYNGLKLTEHSWWCNDFCCAFAEKLVDNPTKVAWIGDYAEPEECAAVKFNYNKVWGDKAVAEKIEPSKFKMSSMKYLINNSKKTYVNLKKYYKSSVVYEEYEGKKYPWCMFPISLLTAIGNNRGGGDYRESGTCFEDVGIWAGDEIYLSNTLPENYEELEVYFKEN